MVSTATLLEEGWQRQTTIDEPRLSELAENYRALGYEVRIECESGNSGAAEFESECEAAAEAGCNSCFAAAAAQGRGLGTIYIRPGKQCDADAENDCELFEMFELFPAGNPET